MDQDVLAHILFSGTTVILLAEEPFERYQKATGATFDAVTGLLTITHAQYEKLLPLDFIINGVRYGSPLSQSLLCCLVAVFRKHSP